MKAVKKLIFKLIFFVPDYILEIWVFELRSWLGRTFSGSLQLKSQGPHLINLGCGRYILPGYINIDFFFEPGIDWGADLRYPLRIADNTIDGILCEHTMEHLTYAQNELLFKECLRILKPGSTLRIIVPDVSLFADAYAAKNQQWFDGYERIMLTESDDPKRAARKFTTPMQAISFVTQEYLHVACWDFDTMKYFLAKSGFAEITKVKHQEGRQANILGDTDEAGRKYVSLYVEAIKPL